MGGGDCERARRHGQRGPRGNAMSDASQACVAT
jgi:hypothetical protein